MKRSRLKNGVVKPRSSRLAIIKQWVAVGYGKGGEGSRALEFKTDSLTPEEASEVAKVVSSYNEYRGKAVAEAILKLRGKVSSVEFGREFSPVLYVHMPFWTHQVAGSKEISGRIFTESENKANVDFVMSVLKKVKPDELDYDSSTNTIRAWWD